MKRKLVWLLIVSMLLALVPSSLAFAETSEVLPLQPAPILGTEEMLDESGHLWFVELTNAPTADGGRLATLLTEKAAFRKAAVTAKVQYQERYAFNTLWNGISIDADASQLAKIARLPGVKAIYPVEVIAIPETTTEASPELYTALAMTGADVAQGELGFTGTGVKVAVMDTGLDYHHPDFGGDSEATFPTGRVIAGYDFVGDAFNADETSPSYNPVPVPDPDPDDVYGHGTHVAGIIGADGTVTGVAPDVLFGAYRVFGNEGSTTADIMIAAMERILADRMQVLNMSIGSAYQWPNYPTAQAADRLVNKGIVVVASIGNNGANGLYSAGAPGLGNKVIGVASFDNTHVFLPYLTVNDRDIGYITMTFSPTPPTSGTYEVVDVGLALLPLPAGSLAGKVALAARGTNSFANKAANCIAGGAVAVLISNNTAGVFSGTLGGVLDGVTPVVGISQADGNFIRAQGAPVMMTWTDQMDIFPSPTGGLISSFSSYGLSPDLTLKPDIGAPGGNIYSTYPVEKGSYTTMSGTSMSSPHVAGAVALLLQAKPKTPPAAVRTLLLNSADPKNWWGNPALGFLDNVHRQGAGMLDIDDSILATTKIEPNKLSLSEGESGPQAKTLTIENKCMSAVTYDLSYVNALSTGGIITPGFFTSDAAVEFSVPSVTIPAGGKVSIVATISPATGPTNGQYGGYIVFTPQGGGQVYRVPFAGFVGDYQGIQVLAPTANEFPWLSIRYGSSYYRLTDPADWTFTMVGTDIPYVLVHLDHQCTLFKLEVFDAATDKAWHVAYQERYLPRNSTTTGFFAFPFDGTTWTGSKTFTVPDGMYYLKLSVLKALGDPSNPAHWETWTSPDFVIDRP